LCGLEDTYGRVQGTLAALAAGQQVPAGLQVYCESADHRLPASFDARVAQLEATLDAHPGIEVVIIDTLARFTGPQRASYTATYELAARVKRLADRRSLSILGVTHTTKSAARQPGGDFVAKILGSTGLTGAADSVLVLERARSASLGVLHIAGRDIAERAGQVTFDGLRWRWVGDANDPQADAERDQIAAVLELLEGHPGRGFRAAEVGAALGFKEDSARWALWRLAQRGQIANPQRGLYRTIRGER
jgi:hypothetical protein